MREHPARRPRPVGTLAIVLTAVVVTLAACGSGAPGGHAVSSPASAPGPSSGSSSAVGSAGIGSSSAAGTPTPTGPPTPVAQLCPGQLGRVRATTAWLATSDGVTLYAATVGDGDEGLVMANDVPHSLCEELPEAAVFARHGFRVEVFDYRDRGESGSGGSNPGRLDLDVEAAAAALTSAGARCVALAGSYGGAAAAIVAATEMQPPPVALVGFDPAAQRGQYVEGPFGPEGAMSAAPRLRMPVVYVTLAGDRFVSVGEVRHLERATGSARKSLVVVPSGVIGWSLLDFGPSSGRVQRAVFGLLDRSAC